VTGPKPISPPRAYCRKHPRNDFTCRWIATGPGIHLAALREPGQTGSRVPHLNHFAWLRHERLGELDDWPAQTVKSGNKPVPLVVKLESGNPHLAVQGLGRLSIRDVAEAHIPPEYV